jgi:lipase
VRLHTHYFGSADAPPLLCLHGITSWGGRFRSLAESRLGAFHVVAPDLRGHGESDWEPPWSLGTHVADIVETLDALSIDRVDVGGHSFGGRLALELASRHPERVAAIILLDPAVWVPPHIALDRAERARQDESYASLDEAVEAKLAENQHARRELVAEDLSQHLQLGEDSRWRPRFARSAVVAAYGEMAKSPPLDGLKAPMLLIRSRESQVVPQSLVDVVLASVPHCEVVTVPGGHTVMWDALDETADAILAFLDDPRD